MFDTYTDGATTDPTPTAGSSESVPTDLEGTAVSSHRDMGDI